MIVVLAAIVAAAYVLDGARCALWAAGAGLATGALFALFSALRSRQVMRLASEVDEVLHEGRRIDFSDYREGDLAILKNQLSKMVPVHSVRLLAEEHSIRREMVLCKVRAEERSVRSELIQLANVFRASILDVSSTSMTLAVIGEESKNEALTDLLREFGILEMVRTGMVALERGRYTIQDERKETLEFNLGKML